MESILKIENIAAGYGRVEIVKGISLHVSKDEIVSIIGPNGTGKSTFLKAIFGLVKVFTGNIFFDNEDITGLKPHQIVKRSMCYVPQDNNIFPSLTIKENLDMGAFVRHDDYSKNIEEVYGIFPLLSGFKNKKAGELSGGQQKMLAIGMSLMLKPKLLLLDEPSAGLAPNMVDEMMKKIELINREEKAAILMVEQNAKRALKISNRGYVLSMGKNMYEGTGEELLNNKDIGKLYLGE
ncbi:MAG: ABC transporter ATP-binding protein [bacterium]|nr:ABC transporter ATP-binding protein [bacterium]